MTPYENSRSGAVTTVGVLSIVYGILHVILGAVLNAM